jgi:hypothetical protein
MNIEHSVADPRRSSKTSQNDRMADARALHFATTMLLGEGLDKGFHFFALHLRVAILELEEHMGPSETLTPATKLAPLSDLPKSARRKPRISASLSQLIRRSES